MKYKNEKLIFRKKAISSFEQDFGNTLLVYKTRLTRPHSENSKRKWASLTHSVKS